MPEWSVEDLARMKGLAEPATLDTLYGIVPDLFDDDAEYEFFLTWLRESRQSDLNPS